MTRFAAALGLVAGLLGPGGAAAHAEALPDGTISIAAHRGTRTFVFIRSVAALEPGVRQRLLASALPEPLPEAEGASGATVVSRIEPVGTPFATWSGRLLSGFDRARQVCSRSIGRLVLLGSVDPKDTSPERMREALANGVLAGELDDRAGACRTADLFHDPELGPLPIADAAGEEQVTGSARDELLGGIGRLRIQPEWVARQRASIASHAAWDGGSPPAVPEEDLTPDGKPPGASGASWDGAGPRAARFALGASPYVAAVSASPGCGATVARLFHAMNQPILIWPSLTFESPAGSLPRWVADVGELWPVLALDGALLAPDGDHYAVLQRFPGTPVPPCASPR